MNNNSTIKESVLIFGQPPTNQVNAWKENNERKKRERKNTKFFEPVVNPNNLEKKYTNDSNHNDDDDDDDDLPMLIFVFKISFKTIHPFKKRKRVSVFFQQNKIKPM